VTGQTDEEHLQKLLKEQGIQLKQVVFLQSAVEYLNYCIDENGIQTLPTKLKAIQQAPTLTGEPWSFLGLLKYYENSFHHDSPTKYPIMSRSQISIWLLN